MGASIVATDLTYAYGDQVAVDGISVSVDPGEVLGFLGPNGAGKSTTIEMLTGQLTPRAGTIEVLGLTMPAQRTAIQQRIRVCFEARLFGLSEVDPHALLERVGLGDRGKDRVREYSKGMRQRLMMARALVNSPDVLFLDEPTDGLDPVSARRIRELIRQEASRGASILLTTHDMMEADALSDRVAFINEGRILALDTPESLKLRHGSRSVRIRTRGPADTVREKVVEMDGQDADAAVRAAMLSGDVLTIHSEEATLEDVFVHFAGRGLQS